MPRDASSSIDFKKWFDRFQPQTLQIATWLLYISGVFMLIDLGNRGSWVWFAKEKYGIGLFVVLVLVACHALGGLLMANDRKLGYWLALVAAFSPFALRIWVLRGTGASTMSIRVQSTLGAADYLRGWLLAAQIRSMLVRKLGGR